MGKEKSLSEIVAEYNEATRAIILDAVDLVDKGGDIMYMEGMREAAEYVLGMARDGTLREEVVGEKSVEVGEKGVGLSAFGEYHISDNQDSVNRQNGPQYLSVSEFVDQYTLPMEREELGSAGSRNSWSTYFNSIKNGEVYLIGKNERELKVRIRGKGKQKLINQSDAKKLVDESIRLEKMRQIKDINGK